VGKRIADPEPRRFKHGGTKGGTMPPAGEDGESGDADDRTENSEPSDGTTDPRRGPGDGDVEDPDGSVTADGASGVGDGAGARVGDPLEESGDIEPGPPGRAGTDDPDSSETGTGGPGGWLLGSDDAEAIFIREFVGSVLVVLVIGMLLFAISGVWPPMVAVKSGSMEPQMERGDLVFVMEEHRFPPKASVGGTGIATHQSGSETGYRRFGNYGDVIIYRKNGDPRATPIIHRARFWVDDGENWYDRADESFVNGGSCEAIRNCPAPHAGFITKGDNNDQYDQVSGISDPVKPGWVKGTAELRIPWLGHIRLELSELVASPSPNDASAPDRAAG